jgi:hypothetical protein
MNLEIFQKWYGWHIYFCQQNDYVDMQDKYVNMQIIM